MSKHTPGPWAYERDVNPKLRPCITTVARCGEFVIGPMSTYPDGNYRDGDVCADLENDARLIAAAPLLLSELKRAREEIAALHQAFIQTVKNPSTGLIDDPDDVLTAEADQVMLDGIDAAIAQAEGAA